MHLYIVLHLIIIKYLKLNHAIICEGVSDDVSVLQYEANICLVSC